jgi:anti-sigma factor RsiW
MGLRHLTDDELQDYLDGNSAELDEWPARHLAQCEQCRQELQLYRALCDGLADSPVEGLASGFPDRVLAALPAKPGHVEREQIGERLLVVFAIAAMAVVSIIFLDWSQLLSFALGSFSGLVGTVEKASPEHFDLRLLGVAAMILLLIPLADRAISLLFRNGASSH